MKSYFEPMHTTEHLLNRTMVNLFGIERSFSNHIEKKKSKCDYKFHRDLTPNEIETITSIVNQQIELNLPVREEFLSYTEAASKYNVSNLPEHATETIRVIHIGDYDACPCIGKHLNNTSEIEGRFKISSTGFENNVLRIRFKLEKN